MVTAALHGVKTSTGKVVTSSPVGARRRLFQLLSSGARCLKRLAHSTMTSIWQPREVYAIFSCAISHALSILKQNFASATRPTARHGSSTPVCSPRKYWPALASSLTIQLYATMQSAPLVTWLTNNNPTARGRTAWKRTNLGSIAFTRRTFCFHYDE